MEDRPRHFQTVLFNLSVLRFCACGQVFEIHILQPGVRRGRYSQSAPESPLSVNAKLQKLQGFEGPKAIRGAASQLQPTDLLAHPGGHFLHSARANTSAFGESPQHLTVRLDVDEQPGGKLAQWLAGILVTDGFEKVYRVYGASEVVV
jgi:hypothetical protein